jgi:hypothetical protein
VAARMVTGIKQQCASLLAWAGMHREALSGGQAAVSTGTAAGTCRALRCLHRLRHHSDVVLRCIGRNVELPGWVTWLASLTAHSVEAPGSLRHLSWTVQLCWVHQPTSTCLFARRMVAVQQEWRSPKQARQLPQMVTLAARACQLLAVSNSGWGVARGPACTAYLFLCAWVNVEPCGIARLCQPSGLVAHRRPQPRHPTPSAGPDRIRQLTVSLAR